MNDHPLCKGMKFSNGHVFRKALQEWAIRRGYSYILTMNNMLIITTVCKSKCGFRIHTSKLRDCDTFQIKNLQGRISIS